jgi:hypothetical protein
VPETKAKYLRIEILDSRACPALTNVGVHKTAAGATAATAATAAPTTTTTTTTTTTPAP